MNLVIVILTLIFCINSPGTAYSQALQENYILNYYNDPPGMQRLNLYQIEKRREITSIPVISPDFQKMVFSKEYYYPTDNHYSSKVFEDDISLFKFSANVGQDIPANLVKKILTVNSRFRHPRQILDTGFKSVDFGIFRTLTIIDFSQDGNKLLIRESVGEHQRGFWLSHAWVYDFQAHKARRLEEVRAAIVYYWKKNYDMLLESYRWDIIPLGWDLNKPDMIVVNAYGYNYDEKYFLGCWGIDSSGNRSRLLSIDNEHWPVGKNGLILEKSK